MNSTIAIRIVDSVTKLGPEHDGAVVVGGSHGGLYAAYLSLKSGARAAIHNDAGIGRDGAGIGGLACAESHGMAMATVSAASARIGDGEDMMRRGRISRVNRLAADAGVTQGMSCAEAAGLLRAAPWPHRPPSALAETRVVSSEGPGGHALVCLDSISLILPEDAGRIVASGSHGGAPAGMAARDVPVTLALFNDAGPGIDAAGVAGLEILDAAGTPAAAVAASSARIGEGRSTWRDGVISHVNRTAAMCGGRAGITALELAARLLDKAMR